MYYKFLEIVNMGKRKGERFSYSLKVYSTVNELSLSCQVRKIV